MVVRGLTMTIARGSSSSADPPQQLSERKKAFILDAKDEAGWVDICLWYGGRTLMAGWETSLCRGE